LKPATYETLSEMKSRIEKLIDTKMDWDAFLRLLLATHIRWGHIIERASELSERERITDRQKKFIEDLSRQLGKEVPPNLDRMSKSEASKLITQLQEEREKKGR